MKINTKLKRFLDGELGIYQPETHKSVWETIESHCNFNGSDMQRERSSPLYKKLSIEQWKVIRFSLADQGLAMPQCLVNGVARRIELKSPLELALYLSFNARLEWISLQYRGDERLDEIWRPLLQAIASRDNLAVSRLSALWKDFKRKPKNLANGAICDGVVALVDHDVVGIEEFLTEITKRKARAYACGVTVALSGIANRDLDVIHSGVEQMLKSFKRFMFGDPALGLLDPFALGIVQLARDFGCIIPSSYLAENELPWDDEFSIWAMHCNNIDTHFKHILLPREIRSALIEMQPLPWAAMVKDTWKQINA